MPDQATFKDALLNAERPVPDGLIDGAGNLAGRRYNVYRNNVAVSLTEALQTGFPILRKLIGEQNFDALAGLYLRAHPPQNPLMMHYGADMPAFLESFAPLAHIGYLPDVARLELGLRASYHAADATPLDPQKLATIPPEDLDKVRLIFAPASILIPSEWPLHAIWRFNTEPGAPKPEPTAQFVLIVRPEFDPAPLAVSPTDGTCLAALMSGEPIGASLAKAPDCDFSALLTQLLAQNALSDITT